MPAQKQVRRVATKWIPQLFRELTNHERSLIHRALGDLPLEPSCGTLELLWERVRAGELGILVLPGQDGALAAVTIYEIEQFSDGSLNCSVLAAVAIGGVTDRSLAHDSPVMEGIARKLGCQSMSMRTIRPGLVKLLTEAHGWFASEITVRKLLN